MIGMTHLSIKCILPYMDAGQRIILQQYPRIKRIDKSRSAKIETLQLPQGLMQIDSLKFEIGIVRYYPGGYTPDWVREENEKGGVQFDVGQFRGLAQAHIVPRMELDRAPTEEETAEKMEAEQKLEDLCKEMEQNPGRITVEAKAEREELEKLIHDYETRKIHSQLEYEEFVKLTVTSRDGLYSVEYVKYQKSLENTWKYLIRRLVKPNVVVVNYIMSSGSEPEIWPFGQSLRVVNLRAAKKFWTSRDIQSMRDVLSSEHTFPLRSMETVPRQSNVYLGDHLARKFIISEAPSQELILKLKCPHVHFKDYQFKSIPFKLIFGLLKKDTLKHYLFETANKNCVHDLIEYCKIDRRLPETEILKGYERDQYPINFDFPLHGTIDVCGSVYRRNVSDTMKYIIDLKCQ
ncbi:hypothetical protein GCK72_026059 [Caenorhabditis remanei]|uniref:DUF38 domain-containing protein n=1 Tax=Caenorhabditis remanei TaxID=31234 RepID=A0A6A5G4E0_CAERE|nr:hypothetical protein GCK72_026059 [Caenorhabditis remanei]KAF1749591.1 hypothetical protein GCK72_026059 [Caenorhabditis remanei]